MKSNYWIEPFTLSFQGTVYSKRLAISLIKPVLIYDNIMGSYCLPIMKDSRLSLRMSSRRLNKLRQYAASKDKTVTQVVEDWVDRLPNTEVGSQGTVLTSSVSSEKNESEEAP